MILSSQTAMTPSHESMILSLFCHSDGITHFNKNVVSFSMFHMQTEIVI